MVGGSARLLEVLCMSMRCGRWTRGRKMRKSEKGTRRQRERERKRWQMQNRRLGAAAVVRGFTGCLLKRLDPHSAGDRGGAFCIIRLHYTSASASWHRYCSAFHGSGCRSIGTTAGPRVTCQECIDFSLFQRSQPHKQRMHGQWTLAHAWLVLQDLEDMKIEIGFESKSVAWGSMGCA